MRVHEETMRRRSTPTLERDIILKYGFPLAGDQYLPHVTLGRLVDIADKVKVEDIFTNEFVYTPRSLVMGRLGVYGDIVEVLNRYYL